METEINKKIELTEEDKEQILKERISNRFKQQIGYGYGLLKQKRIRDHGSYFMCVTCNVRICSESEIVEYKGDNDYVKYKNDYKGCVCIYKQLVLDHIHERLTINAIRSIIGYNLRYRTDEFVYNLLKNKKNKKIRYDGEYPLHNSTKLYCMICNKKLNFPDCCERQPLCIMTELELPMKEEKERNRIEEEKRSCSDCHLERFRFQFNPVEFFLDTNSLCDHHAIGKLQQEIKGKLMARVHYCTQKGCFCDSCNSYCRNKCRKNTGTIIKYSKNLPLLSFFNNDDFSKTEKNALVRSKKWEYYPYGKKNICPREHTGGTHTYIEKIEVCSAPLPIQHDFDLTSP